MKMNNKSLDAFTIVELLIVIVVIGILASLIIVSYAGITKRAGEVSIQTDLSNNSKKLKLYQVEYGSYPSSFDNNNCPTAPVADTKYCMKSNSSEAYFDYQPDGSANPQSFTLLAANGVSGIFYRITENSGPTKISNGWKQISSGYYHTCAIAFDGNAYCWGGNSDGRIGDNTSGTNRLVPTAVYRSGALSGLTIKSITTGNTHTCAIASDDNAYCWGGNSDGRIGDNTSGTNRLAPTAVYRNGALSGLTVKSIAAGGNYTCAIASDNNAYCWGDNTVGQIGDNTSGTNRLVPTAVFRTGNLNSLTIKSIAASFSHACVIASDNNAYCWGDNLYGQIGDNTSAGPRLAPMVVVRTGVLSGLTIKLIATGNGTSCAIASDNNAYCWGRNNYGQVGDNTSGTNRLVPTTVYRTGALSGLTIKSIATSDGHACAIASDNNAYCWGDDTNGQIGDDAAIANKLVPTPVLKTGVLNGLTLKSITSRYYNNCAIASDNQSYCWGDNTYGQIGDNTTGTDRTVPTASIALP